MSSDLSDEEGASPNPSSEVETQAAMEAIRERQQVGTCPRVDYVYYIGICCSNPSSFLQSLIPELIPSSISHLPLHHVYFPFLHLFPYSSSIIYLISPFFIPSFNHSHVPLLPHFPILHSLIQPFPCSSITSFPHSSFPHSTIPLFLYYLISPFFIPPFPHSTIPSFNHSPIPLFSNSPSLRSRCVRGCSVPSWPGPPLEMSATSSLLRGASPPYRTSRETRERDTVANILK